ncbi:MAG: hypothetical protein ACD_75C02465G0003 [uncultured bacterium]|nr:MAG: hypothetical protein ACD_75C02465G0003 [uncultured bacterium]
MAAFLVHGDKELSPGHLLQVGGKFGYLIAIDNIIGVFRLCQQPVKKDHTAQISFGNIGCDRMFGAKDVAGKSEKKELTDFLFQ